jgi:AcrR family transcriptional regulator
METKDTGTRAKQRQATEARVLAAARHLFAAQGYDATTIRAIAAEAGVDPSLVIQYFGSKDRLFVQVAADRWDVESMIAGASSRADVIEVLLEAFIASAGDSQEMGSVSVMIRSSLTNPQAAAVTSETLFQDAALRLLQPVAADPDSAGRAELVAAFLLGVVVSRSLLRVEPLASMPADKLKTYLRAAVLAVLEHSEAGRDGETGDD